MVYKKNWFTYLGYTLFGLLLACLLLMSSGLHIDFSEYNIIKNVILIVPVIICILVLWLASYLFSTLSNKLTGEMAGFLYNIVIVIMFVAAVGIRAYYMSYHTDAFSADSTGVLISVAAFTVGILKLVTVYFTGIIAFGKQGAATALFFEGFLAGEIEACAALDYRNVSVLFVLCVFLLYSIYYKRCNAGKMKTAASWLIIVSITVIIIAGIGVSVYLDYSIAVPVVLAAAIILNMLFAGWKQALVPVLGIPALCAAAYFGVALVDEGYGIQLNNEIAYRMSNIEQIFDEPERTLEELGEYTEHSVAFDNSPTFTIPGGYEYNHDVFVNMLFMIISFISLIYLFFKKRSPLSVYLLFSVGIYMLDSNIMLCNIFVISLCFQEMYEGRDRLSYIVNSPVIDMEEDDDDGTDTADAEDTPAYDISALPEAAISDEQPAVQDYGSSESTDNDDTEHTVTEYGITEPLGETVKAEEPAEPSYYTGSNYGSDYSSNYSSDDYSSDYASDNPETYTGPDTGSVYGAAEEPAEPSYYSGSNYGSDYSSDDYSSDYTSDNPETDTGSAYGAAEEPAEPSYYSGSNYGSDYSSDDFSSDYNSKNQEDYADSAYGAAKTDEDYARDVLDSLPVPKPVSAYVDDNTENIILKKAFDNHNETVGNSFDKDMWQNRKKRATRHTQD